MLDIIDGKLVTVTAEGAFETTPVDAHRQITDLFLQYMQDDNENNVRDNFKNALKLYDIGGKIYKNNGITEQETIDCLVPLMQEIVYDRAERHLSALVMKYVTREFRYKITEKYEVESLMSFFYFTRDNMVYLSLTPTKDQELYYRLVDAFYSEDDYHTLTRNVKDFIFEDVKYVNDDYRAYKKAVLNNTELPIYQPKDYFYVTPTLILIPYTVAKWVDYDKYKDRWDAEDKRNITSMKKIFRLIYQSYGYNWLNKGYPSKAFDDAIHFLNRDDSELKEAYDMAVFAKDYSTQYLIAQATASDSMRRKIAKAIGYKGKLVGGGRSFIRGTKKVLKAAGITLAIYIGYSIIKGLYDFIDLPFIFWFLMIFGVLAGLGGKSTLRTMAVFDHRAYRYVRMQQAEETIKAIKEKK